MGGSSLTESADIPRLEAYTLGQTGKSRPRVCFLPTASADADNYIVSFYAAMLKLDCQPTHLKLFERVDDLRARLFSQDVIYVGGGNTKSMLGVWREYGLPEILHQAWQQGIILSGSSAGAVCWFEQSLTDAYASGLTVLNCLGFLKGSLIPHYDSESERRPAYHRALLQDEILPGYALEDGVALHYIGNQLHRILSVRAGGRAYHVQRTGEAVLEVEIEAEYLE